MSSFARRVGCECAGQVEFWGVAPKAHKTLARGGERQDAREWAGARRAGPRSASAERLAAREGVGRAANLLPAGGRPRAAALDFFLAQLPSLGKDQIGSKMNRPYLVLIFLI